MDAADAAVTLRVDRDRTRRQIAFLALGLLLMLAVAAFGVWVTVQGWRQYPDGAERWVGTVVGVGFSVFGITLIVACIDGIMLARGRLRQQAPLLVVDDRGVEVGDERLPWSAVETLVLEQRLPSARGRRSIGAAVHGVLDRTVGRWFGARDGWRSVELHLAEAEALDDPIRTVDLTHPIGPAEFERAAERIAAIAAAAGVRVRVED